MEDKWTNGPKVNIQLCADNIHYGGDSDKIAPADAASLALWLASFATAHGCPVVLPQAETDAGTPHTPTDAEVEALARVLREEWGEYSIHVSDFPAIARAAFAHINRVPVGVELDVTAEELLDIYEAADRDSAAIDSILDLCRSRIRPVYECPECSETRRHYNDLGAAMQTVLDVSRAAMEGE